MSINVGSGPGLISNQIISLFFARTIYDAFNGFAMVTANAISLSVCD